ncbi:MAG: glycosyltransferase family 4 protein [Pyrinomonadaceae bacterium]|nr:glycosyltransferase family 4 protein [Pyrinomonadaceae bacterium]
MKIGFEVTGSLTETPTGIASYIVNLFSELERLDGENSVQPFAWYSQFKNRRFFLERFPGREIDWHYRFSKARHLLKGFDIAHSTDAKFLDLPGSKRIATVHDLAIFREEVSQLPDYTSEKFKQKVFGNLSTIARKADRIITDSDQTKLDFMEMFPRFDASRIDTVYLAPTLGEEDLQGDEDEIMTRFGIEKKKYFLFIGAVSVRKNLLNMIEAFRESGLSSDLKFLLVGFRSMGGDRILQKIKESGLSERVILTEYIDEALIPALYRNSAGLAFATYYEGFGIPIIEAMKFHVPVMFGNIGSAPEVGREFGVKVDPFSVSEISNGFRKLTEATDDQLAAAFEHASGFTWKKTALETLEVYKKALS